MADPSETQSDWFRLMCENSPDFMVIIDRDRRFRWVNRLHPGVSLSDVIGQPLDQFEHEDTWARSRAATTCAFESGEAQSFESHAVMNNGADEAWYHVRCIPVVGHPDRLLLVTSDVTERKLAERARDRLGQQLHQSRKMEALGRLAGGLAHDFNNLLTPILGYTELAMNALAEDDRARESMREVHEAALRAAELAGQLLSIGRGREPRASTVDLAQLVRGMMGILRRVVPESIVLDTTQLGGNAYVRADRGQLEQVLLNLVINACDAMPDGGKLEIGTTSSDTTAVLWVRDDGVGMDREVLERLFEPFFTTKGARGTGLGLATAHGIAQENSGRIDVESKVGVGSTFRVTFARSEAALTPAGVPQVLASSLPPSSATVLVVEDEPTVRKMVVRLLESAGYTVLEAASGEQAVAHAESTPIDLVLTDVVMPGSSGPEVVRRLRARQRDIQTLFMSGHAMNLLRQDDLTEARVLRKPFTPPQLLAEVSLSLGRSGKSRP